MIHTVSEMIDAVVRQFMKAAMGTIVTLVLLEVFSRNVLDASIYWIEEVAVTYVGTWLVFLGGSHALKHGQLINLQFFVMKLRGIPELLVFWFSRVCILTFLIVVIVYGTRLTLMTMDQPSPALQLPMGLAYFGIVAGCGVMVLHVLASLMKGRSAVTPMEHR